jgi:hypothetical protein
MQEIDKNNPIYKRKQLKATTFSVALFIATALIISGFAGAAVIPGTTMQKNVKIDNIQNTGTQFLTLVEPTMDINRVTPTPIIRSDILQYDDGVFGNAFASAVGDFMHCANRFTPTELAGHNGKVLEAVQFAHFCYPGATQTNTGEVIVYDAGTPTSPGAVLSVEPFSVTSTGSYTETWHEIILSTPVTIDETKDIWLCVYWESIVSGTYPHATDGAANYPGKSLWFSVDMGATWDDLTAYYATYNWMLRGRLEGGGAPVDHDVGVKSIDSPGTGPAAEDLPVEVTVKNYGNNTESDVPVKVEIFKLNPPITTLAEDFEVSVPPAGWTGAGTAPFGLAYDGHDGSCAKAQSPGGYGFWADMTTSTFDGSAGGNRLDFWHKQLSWYGDQDELEVLVSNDAGMTWTPIAYYPSEMDWTFESFDLDSYIAPTSTMQIKFYALLEWGYGVYIDELFVGKPGSGTLEYLDIEYVTVPTGGEETVICADWTPDAWQIVDNDMVPYEIKVQLLYTDDVPANNQMDKLFDLDFPYLYDTAVISVNSPITSGDATTFPVSGTIKNVGQFPSCCYLVNAEIGELDYSTAWRNIRWGGDNDWIQYDYADHSYDPNACGCNQYFAGCYYTQGGTFDVSLVSWAFDLTSAGSSATIEVCEEFQDFAGYGQFGIYVHSGGAPDKQGTQSSNYEETLYYETNDEIPRYGIFRSWSIDPSTYADPSEVYLEFWYSDDGYGNAWGAGIDCLAIPEIGYFEDFETTGAFPPGSPTFMGEYDEDVAAIILDPGDEATVTFPDWTPAHLATLVSDVKDYATTITSYNVDDTNPGNDAATVAITLDFYHEVLVQSITSPTMGRAPWDLLFSFDLEAASGALGNAGAEFDGTHFYSTRWAANLIHQYDLTGALVKEFSIPGVSGLRDLAYNEATGYFHGGAAGGTIWEMDFDTETLIDSISGGFQARAIAYNPDDNVFYCSNFDDPMWVVDASSGAILDTITLGIGATYGMAYDNGPDGKFLYIYDQGDGYYMPQLIHQWDLDAGAMTGFSYDTEGELGTGGIAGGLFTTPSYLTGKTCIGALYQGSPDMMGVYELRAGGGPGPGQGWPPISVYLQSGTQSLDAIVANEGTFPELGLECFAEVLEFITDPENGTSVYNASVPDIELDPLGDTETCAFGSYNFAIQGPYGLYVELPLGVDDYPNNNIMEVGIGIDDTAPTCEYALDPASPDGENGWYVSDLTVTFTADDGDDEWDSGVKEIKYRVNGGSVQTISGATGTYTHSADGENIEIEYWAVDNVDNAGTPLDFDFDMDQNTPDVDIAYEVVGGSALEGWDFVFTATATDDMSGMDRVEFFLNDVLQETVPGSGPTYQWGFKYYGGLAITIRSDAIDIAGNLASDQVANPSSYTTEILSTTTNKVVQLG